MFNLLEYFAGEPIFPTWLAIGLIVAVIVIPIFVAGGMFVIIKDAIKNRNIKTDDQHFANRAALLLTMALLLVAVFIFVLRAS